MSHKKIAILSIVSFFLVVGAVSAANYPIFNDVEPDNINPTAKSSLPSGWYNVDKVVKLSMSEEGAIYYTTNGEKPTETSKKYMGPLNIKSSTTLKFFAVDLTGNKSPVYTNFYKMDKQIPYIKSAYPGNNAKEVSLIDPVKIKFNEKIFKGPTYSKIYIKNLNTGKKVHINKKLKDNKLTITQLKSRLHTNNYRVYLPKGAFKDKVGNLSPKYSYTFKTH